MENRVYISPGIFESKLQNQPSESNDNEVRDEESEIGGLFRVVSHEQQKQKMNKDSMNLTESSLFEPWNANVRNWLDPEVSI